MEQAGVFQARKGGRSVKQMKLGKSGPEVSRIALGCMRLSEDRHEALATIYAALWPRDYEIPSGKFHCVSRSLLRSSKQMFGVHTPGVTSKRQVYVAGFASGRTHTSPGESSLTGAKGMMTSMERKVND